MDEEKKSEKRQREELRRGSEGRVCLHVLVLVCLLYAISLQPPPSLISCPRLFFIVASVTN